MTTIMTKTVKGSLLTGIAMAALCTASAGHAQSLRIALGLPEIWGAYDPLVSFAETLKSEAGLDAEVFALSLLSLAETPAGVRDGVADMGLVVFPYFPAEYSEVNLIANLSMLATTGKQVEVPGAAMLGASMEYTMLDCADCQAELSDQNQVFIAGMSTGPYALMCTEPLASIEEVAGRRFRAGAANFARWAEEFGGSTVSVTGNEIYTAMSQGTVDCTMNSVGDLLGNRYIDVTKAVTLGAPGGVFAGVGAANVNRDSWESLTEEQRGAVIKAAAQLAADTAIRFHEDDTKALAAAKEQGLEIIEAPAEMMKATEEFLAKDIEVVKQQFTDNYGVENVAEKVDRFQRLVEKWKGLVEEAGTDAGKLGELYWTEVHSKIDPASYGLD